MPESLAAAQSCFAAPGWHFSELNVQVTVFVLIKNTRLKHTWNMSVGLQRLKVCLDYDHQRQTETRVSTSYNGDGSTKGGERSSRRRTTGAGCSPAYVYHYENLNLQ